jgi:hypothetical protein
MCHHVLFNRHELMLQGFLLSKLMLAQLVKIFILVHNRKSATGFYTNQFGHC